MNDLADLILSQPLVGTTIKTDGIESDPYAYLTVLNMHIHQVCPSCMVSLVKIANIVICGTSELESLVDKSTARIHSCQVIRISRGAR